MTIQDQLTGRPSAHSGSADRPTIGMDARQQAVPDPFSLLDHRTRARSLDPLMAPPGSYLSVEDGEDLKLIPLDRPLTHVGRGLAADVRVEDPHVSRRHAIVVDRSDGVRVLDDRSLGGTFVNGRPVTAAGLTAGDVLRVGRVAFRFVEISPRHKPQPLRRIALARRGRRRDPEPIHA